MEDITLTRKEYWALYRLAECAICWLREDGIDPADSKYADEVATIAAMEHRFAGDTSAAVTAFKLKRDNS